MNLRRNRAALALIATAAAIWTSTHLLLNARIGGG